jgi:hypothetical protein
MWFVIVKWRTGSSPARSMFADVVVLMQVSLELVLNTEGSTLVSFELFSGTCCMFTSLT